MKRVAATALVGVAAASVAVNFHAPAAWLFAGVALLSLFWRSEAVRSGAVEASERLLHLSLLGIAVIGWIEIAYPILSAQEVRTWALRFAYSAGALGSLLLLAGRGLSPWTGVIPAALGLLVASSFDSNAPTHGFLVAAGLAGFVYLASDLRVFAGDRRLARSVLTAVFGLLAAGVATAIVRVLPWTQDRVQDTLMSVYAPMSDGIEGQHQTRLGDLRRLKLSKKIVMRVWSERPQKLRGRVFVRFDGSYWRRAPRAMRLLEASELPPPGPPEFLAMLPGSDFVLTREGLEDGRRIRTKVLRVDGSGLPIPGGSRLVRAPVDRVRIDRAGVLLPPPRTSVRIYGVLHDLNHQRAQEGPLEALERDAALRLPELLDPRVAELAEAVAGGASTAEETAERIVAYLRENYRYSLDVGAIDRRDPLADFLFDKKRGWCEYFAGAAAVMLRSLRIPTRYVEGFNVPGSERKGNYYLVRELDRHAWIEAYIEGKGWLEYDPTPAAEYETLHAGLRGGLFSDALEWVRVRAARFYVWLRYFEWWRLLGIGPWLGLVAAVSLTLRLVRARRAKPPATDRRASAPYTGLEPLIRELDRRASDLGFPRARHEAPLEHWANAPSDLPATLRDAGLRIVERFYRARFGGVTVAPGEIEALERELGAIARSHEGPGAPVA